VAANLRSRMVCTPHGKCGVFGTVAFGGVGGVTFLSCYLFAIAVAVVFSLSLSSLMRSLSSDAFEHRCVIGDVVDG